MDIDPLSDSVPPRHAIESDDEDEFNPLSSSTPSVQHNLQFKISESVAPGGNLIIATGDAGRAWARGANLGKQMGRVSVNNAEIGMLFKPTWTSAAVLVSEPVTLPVWAPYGYCNYILEHWKPTRLIMLDSYSVSAYIASESISSDRAPIRYICTSGDPSLSPSIQPFSPPNMIQSTSAAFMSAISIQATLLLLPSPQLPARPPRDIIGSSMRALETSNTWSEEVLRLAHSSLISLSGGQSTEWVNGRETPSINGPPPRKHVEGNMYI